MTSKTRSPLLPDVPTVAESGLPGFENSGWFGFMLPAGTPQAIVDKIHKRHAEGARRHADSRRACTWQGMAPVGNTPKQFAERDRRGVEAVGGGGARTADFKRTGRPPMAP